jgi:hypothetical protein
LLVHDGDKVIRVLGPRAGDRLVTRYPGYLGAGVGGARRSAGFVAGPPLADIASELLHQDEVPRLEQLRLQALEWRIDAGLHLGGHRELVLELQTLTAQHPLREHFHAQLMLGPLLVRTSGRGAGRLPACARPARRRAS